MIEEFGVESSEDAGTGPLRSLTAIALQAKRSIVYAPCMLKTGLPRPLPIRIIFIGCHRHSSVLIPVLKTPFPPSWRRDQGSRFGLISSHDVQWAFALPLRIAAFVELCRVDDGYEYLPGLWPEHTGFAKLVCREKQFGQTTIEDVRSLYSVANERRANGSLQDVIPFLMNSPHRCVEPHCFCLVIHMIYDDRRVIEIECSEPVMQILDECRVLHVLDHHLRTHLYRAHVLDMILPHHRIAPVQIITDTGYVEVDDIEIDISVDERFYSLVTKIDRQSGSEVKSNCELHCH